MKLERRCESDSKKMKEFFNMVKAIYKVTADIILSMEDRKLPSKIRSKTRMPTLVTED